MLNTVRSTSDKLKFKDYTKHGDIDKYIAEHVGIAWTEYRQKWKNATTLKEFYHFPLYITLEQHFKCNYSCIMCYHSDKKQKDLLNHKQRLSRNDMIKIINEISKLGTPSLCMNAGNEPLMDKDIWKWVKYAKQQGILDVFMTTNGSLLTEDMAKKLIDAGLTQIRVSIDAFTPETYKKIRGHDLEKVKKNVLNLIELRDKKGSFFPMIRVSFVEMKINIHEFESFRDYWKKLVDYVSIQRFTPVNLKPEMLRLTPERPIHKKTVCSMPFCMLYIRGDGETYPCGRIEYGSSIGNIKYNSIYEMWNGEKLNNIRELLIDLKYKELPGCNDCFTSASLI